mgnify:FL=1
MLVINEGHRKTAVSIGEGECDLCDKQAVYTVELFPPHPWTLTIICEECLNKMVTLLAEYKAQEALI